MEIPNSRILNNIEKSQKSQLKNWIPEIPKMAFMTLIMRSIVVLALYT